MDPIVLASALDNIGDGLLETATDWATKALLLGLLIIVVVKVFTRMSIKAGIGALLGLALCVGIYASREDLSKAVSDEIKENSAPAVQIQYPVRARPASAGAVGGEVL